MKKVLGFFFITILLLLAFAFPTTAANPIPIYIDGKQVTPDVPPVLRNGRVFVPIRFISESLGAAVYWRNPEIFIYQGDTSLQLALGETKPDTALDIAPFLVNSRTMVPLRYIAESLRVNVDYKEGKVLITNDRLTAENEDVPIFKVFPVKEAIYQEEDILVFKDNDDYFMCSDVDERMQQVSDNISHVSAVKLDKGCKGSYRLIFSELADDGSLVFACFSFVASAVTEGLTSFFSISNNEVKPLGRVMGAFLYDYKLQNNYIYYVDDYLTIWPSTDLSHQASAINKGNIKRINIHGIYSEDNPNSEIVGDPDFIYGYYLTCHQRYGNENYSSYQFSHINDEEINKFHWEFAEKENCIYVVGVNPSPKQIVPQKVENPSLTAGYYKIDLTTNTQTKIRDLTPDEYQVITTKITQ